MRRTLLQKIVGAATILLMLTGISACRQNNKELRRDRIVTAISADFDSLNPLLIQFSMSREVCKLLYPSLVKPAYDEKKGGITFLPNTARSWELSENGKQVIFHLRSDALWEDGEKVTSHDFKYSYTLYKNPEIASSRQHYLNDLVLLPDGTADIARAVETPDDSTLVLHFSKPMAQEIVLDHFNDLMPVAEHVFKAFLPDEIRTRAAEIPIVSAGPFKVKKWARQEKLELVTNPFSALPHPATITNMVFMVVPEYTTRLAMLKSGQIDAMLSAG
ncbi:MAG: ABC transporter substrate-binding protein, partial [Chlorobiaceae bacterium]